MVTYSWLPSHPMFGSLRHGQLGLCVEGQPLCPECRHIEGLFVVLLAVGGDFHHELAAMAKGVRKVGVENKWM